MPSCLNIAQTILNDMSKLLVQIKIAWGILLKLRVDNSLFNLTLTLFCDILSDNTQQLISFLS